MVGPLVAARSLRIVAVAWEGMTAALASVVGRSVGRIGKLASAWCSRRTGAVELGCCCHSTDGLPVDFPAAFAVAHALGTRLHLTIVCVQQT